MLKYIIQPEKKYKGYTYKSRKIIADEKLLERLVKVPEAIVYSSWRSLAEQKVLVAEGKSKTLYSNHRRGMAVDCVNWKEVQDKMRKVGLINDISWDLNHFAFDGESKASKYQIYDTIQKELQEYKQKDKKTKKETSKIEPKKEEGVEVVQDTIEDTKTVSSSIPSLQEPTVTADVIPVIMASQFIKDTLKFSDSSISEKQNSDIQSQDTFTKLSDLPKIEPTLFQRFIKFITNLIKKL